MARVKTIKQYIKECACCILVIPTEGVDTNCVLYHRLISKRTFQHHVRVSRQNRHRGFPQVRSWKDVGDILFLSYREGIHSVSHHRLMEAFRLPGVRKMLVIFYSSPSVTV